MEKKGSLSISTNAIVVLIIAVVMLGLILGFVYRAFQQAENQFLEQIKKNEPNAPAPTSSRPITVSQEYKIAGRGDNIGLKIAMKNTKSSPRFFQPKISCAKDTALFENVQTVWANLEVNEEQEVTWIAKIKDGANPQVYLCNVELTEWSPPLGAPAGTVPGESATWSSAGVASTQIQVEVRGDA